jgi:hypothetical protein
LREEHDSPVWGIEGEGKEQRKDNKKNELE